MSDLYRIKEEIVGERLVLGDPNSTLSFDSQKQLISFESSQAFHTQSVALSFAVIEQVRLESRREKKGLQLMLTFTSQGKRYEREFSLKQAERHEEAADLFFRVATIMGAAGYFVRRSTEAYLDLELLAEAPKEVPVDDPFRSLSYGAHALQEGSTREVPEVKERANYNEDRGGFKEPTETIAPFDPKSFASKLEPTSFTHYRPGQRVELHRDLYQKTTKGGKVNLLAALVMVPIIILATGVIGLGLWMITRERTFEAAGTILIGAVLFIFAVVIFSQIEEKQRAIRVVSEFIEQRSFDFDWRTNTLKLLSTSPTRSIPFEEIEGMVLRSTIQKNDSDPQRKSLLHRLVLLLPGPDESLLCKEDSGAHPTRDDSIFQFMIEMCRELSIPWRVEVEQ